MPNYSIEIERAALRDIKRFPRPLRELILEHLDRLAEDPLMGELLTGVLSRFHSCHFSHKGVQYRIAYLFKPDEKKVLVVMVRPRENFYQVLRRRLGV